MYQNHGKHTIQASSFISRKVRNYLMIFVKYTFFVFPRNKSRINEPERPYELIYH